MLVLTFPAGAPYNKETREVRDGRRYETRGEEGGVCGGHGRVQTLCSQLINFSCPHAGHKR